MMMIQLWHEIVKNHKLISFVSVMKGALKGGLVYLEVGLSDYPVLYDDGTLLTLPWMFALIRINQSLKLPYLPFLD